MSSDYTHRPTDLGGDPEKDRVVVYKDEVIARVSLHKTGGEHNGRWKWAAQWQSPRMNGTAESREEALEAVKTRHMQDGQPTPLADDRRYVEEQIAAYRAELLDLVKSAREDVRMLEKTGDERHLYEARAKFYKIDPPEQDHTKFNRFCDALAFIRQGQAAGMKTAMAMLDEAEARMTKKLTG